MSALIINFHFCVSFLRFVFFRRYFCFTFYGANPRLSDSALYRDASMSKLEMFVEKAKLLVEERTSLGSSTADKRRKAAIDEELPDIRANIEALRLCIDGTDYLRARRDGLRSSPRLVGYASEEVHSCVVKAFEVLGIGRDALHRIEVNHDTFAMRFDALQQRIIDDRAAGPIYAQLVL